MCLQAYGNMGCFCNIYNRQQFIYKTSLFALIYKHYRNTTLAILILCFISPPRKFQNQSSENEMSSASKYERKPKTSVFHIRIGNNLEKIDLKDPTFLKILEQEYATKYLQSLGVQSTSKNITKILKEYPIQNCQIVESRLNGGLYTDTITIIPKSYNNANENQNKEKQTVSNEMLQILDLKRIGEKKYQSQNTNSQKSTNVVYNQNSKDQVMEDSILGNLNANQQHSSFKKTNTANNNTNNFRVNTKNTQGRANSNTFLSDKSSFAQKSGVNLFNNYDDIGFIKQSQHEVVVQTQNHNEKLSFLSFNIQDIKSRYIFPFNDNFKRKSNYRLVDNSNLIEPQDPKIVYEWKIFHFPFTQVKLSLKTLKQLQNPINAKMNDIQQFLDSFYQEFPSHAFPLAPEIVKKSTSSLTQGNLNTSLTNPQINIPSNLRSNQASYSSASKAKNNTTQFSDTKSTNNQILFTKQQIDQMFSTIRSQSMVKLIGVFLHLAYWCIFGGVNPIQIQSIMKKKMYVMMFETIQYFQIKIENKKMWAILVFPMILLVLKMASHYFFSTQYPKIFQSQQATKVGVDELAVDKVMYLIEKMFDQGNINGRFIFLESEITGAKGTFLKDKQFIGKRIFGTSPTLQIILPNPKNGKARAIIAKNNQKEKGNIISLEKWSSTKQPKIESINAQNQQYQQKLLSLALHKISNRIQQAHGYSNQSNPIVNIKE